MIPTNFPTKRLEVLIDRSNCGGAIAIFDYTWNPGREVEIMATTWATNSASLAFRLTDGTNNYNVATVTGTNIRQVLFSFDPVGKAWRTSVASLPVGPDGVAIPGGGRYVPVGPATVEEWEALWRASQ